jgi:hypothetical protein
MSTDPVAKLASQLQAFINTKHPFASDLDLDILQSIESYAPPPTSSPGPASTSQERRSRSIARPLESPPYPVEWADSRSPFRTALRHFQELLKRRTALGSTSATLEASQSHTDQPISSTITEHSALVISTTQASRTHQIASQETTTMSGSSDSPTGQGTPHFGANER